MSGMTDHPLTETDAAEMWDEHHVPASPILRWALAHESEREATLALLRAAFDAGREHEHTNTEDPRPWEPLNEGDPLNVGDEARQDRYGLTITGVVARVDGSGDPWTAEGAFIGLRRYGTWYVRRTVPELPTTPGIPIVANDGHESIEAVFSGVVWRTSEAVLGLAGLWHGVWRSGRSVVGSVSPELITPGTWKVDDR